MNDNVKKLIFHGTASAFYAVILFTFFTHKYAIFVERMLTTWYLALHIAFIFLRFIEDIVDYFCEGKDRKLIGILSTINNLTFISLIFPFALYIPLVYWLLIYYNSSLVHPNFLELSLPSWVSTISHSAIAVVALVEMFTHKYSYKGCYVISLGILLSFATVYMMCLVGTYWEYGFWLYPLFHSFCPSTLPYVFILLIILLIGMFLAGGIISNFFHGEKKSSNKDAEEHKSRNPSKTQNTDKVNSKLRNTLTNIHSIFKKTIRCSRKIIGNKKEGTETTFSYYNVAKKQRKKPTERSVFEAIETLTRYDAHNGSDSSLNSSDISEMSNHVDSDHGNKLFSSDDRNSTNAAYGSGGETAIKRHAQALAADSFTDEISESDSYQSSSTNESNEKKPTTNSKKKSRSSSTRKSKTKKSKRYLKKNSVKTLHVRVEFIPEESCSEESVDLEEKSKEKNSFSPVDESEQSEDNVKSRDTEQDSNEKSNQSSLTNESNVKKPKRCSKKKSVETFNVRMEFVPEKQHSFEEHSDSKKKSREKTSSSSSESEQSEENDKSKDSKPNLDDILSIPSSEPEENKKNEIRTKLRKNMKIKNHTTSIDSEENSKIDNVEENSSDHIKMNLRKKNKNKSFLEKTIHEPNKKLFISSSESEQNQKNKISSTSRENRRNKSHSSSIDSDEISMTENTEENSSDHIELNLQMKKKGKSLLEKILKSNDKIKLRKESSTDSEKNRKNLKSIFLRVTNAPTKNKNNRLKFVENNDSPANTFREPKQQKGDRIKLDVSHSSEPPIMNSVKVEGSSSTTVNNKIKNSSECDIVPLPTHGVTISPQVSSVNHHGSPPEHSGQQDSVDEVTFEERRTNDVNASRGNYSPPETFVGHAEVTEGCSNNNCLACNCDQHPHRSSDSEKESINKKENAYIPIDQPIPSTSGINSKALSKIKGPLLLKQNLTKLDSFSTKGESKELKNKLEKSELIDLDRIKMNKYEKLPEKNETKQNKREKHDEKVLKRTKNEKTKKKVIENESKNDKKIKNKQLSKNSKISKPREIKEKHKKSLPKKTDKSSTKIKTTDDAKKKKKTHDLENERLERKNVRHSRNKINENQHSKSHRRMNILNELLPSKKNSSKISKRGKFDSDSTAESFHENKPRKKKKRQKSDDEPKKIHKRAAKKHEEDKREIVIESKSVKEEKPSSVRESLNHEQTKNLSKNYSTKVNQSKSNTVSNFNSKTLKTCRSGSNNFPCSRKQSFIARLFNLQKPTENDVQLGTTNSVKSCTKGPQIEAIFKVIGKESGNSYPETNIEKLLENLQKNESCGGVRSCKFYAKLLCRPASCENIPETASQICKQPNMQHLLSYMEELQQKIARKSPSQYSTSA